MSDSIKRNSEVCPRCGGDLDWGQFEIRDGMSGSYEASCTSCDFVGRQWINLSVDGWQENKGGHYEDIKSWAVPASPVSPVS